MMTAKIHAWMSLGRMSNLPTIITNILVGTAVATSLGGGHSWSGVGVVIAGVVLLYIGGMILNDLFDYGRDSRRGVLRPLVTGDISSIEALAAMVIVFAGAMVIFLTMATALASTLAMVLLATIVLYNKTHHSFPNVAPVLLTVCRGLVYAIAASQTTLQDHWDVIIAIAVLGGAYGGLITSAATQESDAPPRRVPLGLVLLPVPLILIVLLVHEPWTGPMLLAILLFLVWWSQTLRDLHVQEATLRGAIMRSLAGYALMDTVILLSLADRDGAIIAAACFVVTLFAHRSVSGT
jgi:hypothetical protein